MHRYIGFLLHRNAERSDAPQSLMSEDLFRNEISKFLRKEFGYEEGSDKLSELTNQIIKESRDRLVLLVEPLQGEFGFELRTFQEFFAAQYLTQAKDSDQKV